MPTALFASFSSLCQLCFVCSNGGRWYRGAQLPSRAALHLVTSLPLHITMPKYTRQLCSGPEVAKVVLQAVESILLGRVLTTEHDAAGNAVEAHDSTLAVIAQPAGEPVLGIEGDDLGAA